MHSRGPVSGTSVVYGNVAASWGEPRRADLTFSIAKTYLALLAGVATDRGWLPEFIEPTHLGLPATGFEAGGAERLTWDLMLTQTSEWEGTGIDGRRVWEGKGG